MKQQFLTLFKAIKGFEVSRPTVAERSQASVLRSWKRKVVGSNPGGAEIEHRFLLIGFARRLIRELERQQRRLQKGDCFCETGNDSRNNSRGGLNQPSSSGCGAI